MPSLELYRKINSAKTVGEAHKERSDMLMNATWDYDIGSRVGYLYDHWHDVESFEKYKLRDLHPQNDDQKIPIDIKFQQYSSQTFAKDVVTFHIQFRPGQKCNVPYYEERYGQYDSIFPVGLFIDIEDESGQFNRWLIVGTANFYTTQFPTYEVLPCDYVFQYVYERKQYQIVGCTRSQSSYTSGVFVDFKVTSMDDVGKMIVPLNTETENLYYNQRIIVDVKGLKTQPRCYEITKPNRITTKGIIDITLKQTTFNEHTDYIEEDDDGNVIGYWANYFSGDTTPIPADEPSYPSLHSEITYKGKQDGLLKVGGNGRTFVVTFYDIDNNVVNIENGEWQALVNGEPVPELISITPSLADGKAKIKLSDKDDLIGDSVTILYISDGGIKSSIDMNIVGL